MLRSQARLWGWLVYFLSAIFISLFTCCSVSIYPWWGLLLGRNDHFQQQSPRIRATCHIVPVTTNDYQCIWASCQCAGLGTAGGVGGGSGGDGGGGGGAHAPRRQRFSSHVAALKPHITSPQSTKCLTYHVPKDWINLLWEADSDTACLEARLRRESESPITRLRGGGGQQRHGGHLIHPTVKPSFPHLPSAHLYSQGQRGWRNFILRIYFLEEDWE